MSKSNVSSPRKMPRANSFKKKGSDSFKDDDMFKL